MRAVAATFLLGALATSSAFSQTPPAPARPAGPGLIPLLIESNAFADGAIVPDKYSFRGGNVQPDFKISNAPENVLRPDCSVNATAGSPSATACAQVRAMSPPGASQDHWLCTCPSAGSATPSP